MAEERVFGVLGSGRIFGLAFSGFMVCLSLQARFGPWIFGFTRF